MESRSSGKGLLVSDRTGSRMWRTLRKKTHQGAMLGRSAYVLVRYGLMVDLTIDEIDRVWVGDVKLWEQVK